MRGSPLLRTIFVILGLALAIIPLWKITHRSAAPAPTVTSPKNPAQKIPQPTPFTLTLSHQASNILLTDAAGTELWKQSEPSTTTDFTGSLDHLPESLLVTITWASPTSTGRHFAKLQLDPVGQNSLTHIFDSSSDIDDIWELP